MIPRKLELKNFLSYGDTLQTIDFDNHTLICLSGKNGHGKSALLDAITWAIWGQARKTTGVSKADEGLIRLGQTRMMVALSFSFANKEYRVRREYTKAPSKACVSLDFEIFDEKLQRFHSLTDKTIRATQDKIEHLIGIDYETFINSAFLRQGQANEFSKKTSKERKQIIASILGLEKYDLLQHQALEKVKKHTDARQIILRDITAQQEKIDQEPSLQTLLQQIQQQRATINQELAQLQEKILAYQKQRLILDQAKERLTTLFQKEQSLKMVQADLENKIRSTLLLWKSAHAQSLQITPQALLEQEQATLIIKEKEMRGRQEQSLSLQEKILETERTLHQKRLFHEQTANQTLYSFKIIYEKLAAEQLQNQRTITEKKQLLQDKTKQLEEITKNHLLLRQDLSKRALFEIKYEEKRLQFEKRKLAYQNFMEQGKRWQQERKELDHKKRVTQDQLNPACPLCEQLLTQGRKRHLAGRFQQQEQFIIRRIAKLTLIIKNLKSLLLVQHEELERGQKQQQHFIALHQQEIQLREQTRTVSHDIKLLQDEVHTLQEQQKNVQLVQQETQHNIAKQEQLITNLLLHNKELQTLMQQISHYQGELATIGYDPAQLQALQKSLEIIRNQLQNIQPTAQQKQLLQELRSRISQMIYQLRQTKHSRQEIDGEIKALQKELANEASILTSLNHDVSHHKTLSQEQEKLVRTEAGLDHQLAQLQKIKIALAALLIECSQHEDEIQDYQQLALAFSKNGIQALLIEEAIPEIEQEANTILSRLTENQAQIFIESLRDLKSGKVKETLDIQIADNAGIRPYEMFSGGEAFRIDFALRIAISKLLARRAGTALQTLIIDEGFGSQDEEGLRHIMGALHAIQHDFSKIIVVSHLHEFKDNFPIHFLIEKKSTGSVIHIEEKG